MPPGPILFVVDDEPAMLKSLRQLGESAGLRVETFSCASEFLANCSPERAGCVLLDLNMPDMDGLELQGRLKSLSVSLPVIFLTGHGDIPTAVRAIKEGAVDFIEKPFEVPALLERIRAAMAMDAEARARRDEWISFESRLHRLTAREREVMDLLVGGISVKAAAARLGLSHKTVQVHRARIMEKLEVNTTAELVRRAVQSCLPLAV